MIAVAIIAHCALGKRMLEAAELICGPQNDIKTLDFFPDTDKDILAQSLSEFVYENKQNGVIILTDLFGGVPSNIAISSAGEGGVEVVAGVSLPMIIKLLSIRDSASLENCVVEIQDAGRKYIYVASRVLSGSSPTAETQRLSPQRNADLIDSAKAKILELKDLLQQLEVAGRQPGIGHNRPPEDILDNLSLDESIIATESIKIEEKSKKKRKDVLQLCQLIFERLQKTLNALTGWLLEKVDRLVNAVIDASGKTIPIALVLEELLKNLRIDIHSIIELIHKLIGSL